MRRFRKLPVEIEAMRFDGSWQAAQNIMAWAQTNKMFWQFGTYRLGTILIHTLEGTHTASPNDWIIRDVNGEFYPCKPDIFAKTYEAVTDSTND